VNGYRRLGTSRPSWSIRVTGTAQRGAVVSKMKEFVEYAREQGYRRDELVAMLLELPSR
jgi:hypothetical protein